MKKKKNICTKVFIQKLYGLVSNTDDFKILLRRSYQRSLFFQRNDMSLYNKTFLLRKHINCLFEHVTCINYVDTQNVQIIATFL